MMLRCGGCGRGFKNTRSRLSHWRSKPRCQQQPTSPRVRRAPEPQQPTSPLDLGAQTPAGHGPDESTLSHDTEVHQEDAGCRTEEESSPGTVFDLVLTWFWPGFDPYLPTPALQQPTSSIDLGAQTRAGHSTDDSTALNNAEAHQEDDGYETEEEPPPGTVFDLYLTYFWPAFC